MPIDTSITIGLVVFATALILAGWRAAWWITDFANKFRNGISQEIIALRKSVDDALKDQRDKNREAERETREAFRSLEKDFQSFKLDVSERYATKSDIESSTRLILAEMRAAFAEVKKSSRDRDSD